MTYTCYAPVTKFVDLCCWRDARKLVPSCRLRKDVIRPHQRRVRNPRNILWMCMAKTCCAAHSTLSSSTGSRVLGLQVLINKSAIRRRASSADEKVSLITGFKSLPPSRFLPGNFHCCTSPSGELASQQAPAKVSLSWTSQPFWRIVLTLLAFPELSSGKSMLRRITFARICSCTPAHVGESSELEFTLSKSELCPNISIHCGRNGRSSPASVAVGSAVLSAAFSGVFSIIFLCTKISEFSSKSKRYLA
jgi:hypothetical protein